MIKSMKNEGFGRKNGSEHAVSFAQMLLSGKPLARQHAAKDVRTPQFKAKRKSQFGRNVEAQFATTASDRPETSSGDAPPWWRLWAR